MWDLWHSACHSDCCTADVVDILINAYRPVPDSLSHLISPWIRGVSGIQYPSHMNLRSHGYVVNAYSMSNSSCRSSQVSFTPTQIRCHFLVIDDISCFIWFLFFFFLSQRQDQKHSAVGPPRVPKIWHATCLVAKSLFFFFIYTFLVHHGRTKC